MPTGYGSPTVVVLREGTDTSQGTPQLLSNISACLAIAGTISSTLGPRGMDKLIVGANGTATISNDGATILKLLEVVHPAAKTLVDIARAQDAEVGDGTTSVVLLAAELLRESQSFIEDGVSPHVIMKGYRKAAQLVSDMSDWRKVGTWGWRLEAHGCFFTCFRLLLVSRRLP